MGGWTADAVIEGRPEEVLAVLTDPGACGRWAPIDFEVEDLDGPRLATGTRARVNGRLAGQRVGFDVDVHEAGPQGLALTASGPIGLDVELEPAGAGSRVVASIGVRPGEGLSGRLPAPATAALLAGGALDHALSRIAREAEALWVRGQTLVLVCGRAGPARCASRRARRSRRRRRPRLRRSNVRLPPTYRGRADVRRFRPRR